jgi:hypothetical protein
MDHAKEIIVRYRAEGHVRFQLPKALCVPATAERLATGLHRIEGVYRVDLSPRQRKLSVRFIEYICDFRTLALALHGLVEAAASAEPGTVPELRGESLPAVLRNRLSAMRPVGWVRAKLREARETVTAMGILARRQDIRQRARSLVSEDTVILVLNDVLVFYLIKLHWRLIARDWVRQPWRYRYEWLAVSYMIYLLLRSRRPKD